MDITVKNLQSKIPVYPTSIKAVGLKVSRSLGLGKHHQDVSVVFVGPKKMRQINKKFLGHDYVTDVITFDDGPFCAEIVICPQVALRQAKDYGVSVKREILLYLVHGLLHLAGYDDAKPEDFESMQARQEDLLERYYV